MTLAYTVFDTATGAILRTGTAMTVESAQLQGSKPGTRVTLVDSNPITQAVDPGTSTPVAKLPMQINGALTTANKTTIPANGVDAIVISNVPNGAKYDIYLPSNLGLVQPQDGIVTDGVLRVTTTVPGFYSVRLSYLNYLDFTVTFNAN